MIGINLASISLCVCVCEPVDLIYLYLSRVHWWCRFLMMNNRGKKREKREKKFESIDSAQNLNSLRWWFSFPVCFSLSPRYTRIGDIQLIWPFADFLSVCVWGRTEICQIFSFEKLSGWIADFSSFAAAAASFHLDLFLACWLLFSSSINLTLIPLKARASSIPTTITITFGIWFHFISFWKFSPFLYPLSALSKNDNLLASEKN